MKAEYHLKAKKVLVIPWKRWLRPDMTEKLLTGTLSPNTNKFSVAFLMVSSFLSPTGRFPIRPKNNVRVSG